MQIFLNACFGDKTRSSNVQFFSFFANINKNLILIQACTFDEKSHNFALFGLYRKGLPGDLQRPPGPNKKYSMSVLPRCPEKNFSPSVQPKLTNSQSHKILTPYMGGM
jgi:hypothetical protein